MRVTILGNSNSLLADGWLKTFRSLRPDCTILNLSVGGSPSPALIYQILARREELLGSDIILVEPTVVDHGEGWQSPELIASFARATLEMALSSGASVYLIALPRNATHLMVPSPGMLAWCGAASLESVPVIDVRTSLLKHAATTEGGVQSLWRDDRGHLTAEMQIMVAHQVVAAMGDRSTTTTPRDQPSQPYRVISGANLALQNGLPSIMRTSSLMTVNCVQLSAGQGMDVQIAISESILGFMLNYGEIDPSQTIRLILSNPKTQSTQPINLQNNFMQAKPTRSLLAMFVRTNAPDGHDQVLLPLIKEHARFSPDGDQRLEIIGILVGQKPKPVPSWRSDGAAALSPAS
jgi:hypothetical protein